MKIGLRTVKTAISAALAMIIAEKLGLLYAPSAGIISVLSVTSTKKNICHDRNLSFVILSFSNYFSVYLFYFFRFYSDCFWYFFIIIYSSSRVFSII
ncbi:aromatic acid exporter family protein [Enterococcus faecalis]|uniref:aromatic acid exporter family protein n=1 Tax=Enterococcus faecalis TaxID=1351 RepID=UPI0039C86957